MRLSGIHYCRLIPHFPGYRAAIRAAGLSPHPNGVRIETSAMLQDWGKLARKKGRVPTRDEYEREGRYAFGSLETRFHRWSQIPAAFLKFAASTGLAGEWSDVIEKIRTGPMPTRGGGRHWLKKNLPYKDRPWLSQPAPPAVAAVIDVASGPPDQPQQLSPPTILPPPLHGKKCVTIPMLAILVNETATLAGLLPRRVLPDRPLLGPPTTLPGLAHEPVNEMGVVLLFGMLLGRLGFVVESVQMGFPDCLLKIEVEPGRWQYLRVEFEYESRHFASHHHDPAKCDMIVCWRHNWKNCPPHIQVLELRSIVRGMTGV
jgi:hypothetical protein